MIERFIARGTDALWLASSIEALEQSGFRAIYYEPGKDEVSGYKDGRIKISVLPVGDNTQLTIESDSKEDLEYYKKRVAPILSVFSKEPEEFLYIKLSTPIGEYIEESTETGLVPSQIDIFSPKEDEVKASTPKRVKQVLDTGVANIPWYQTKWFILLISVFIPPVGIFMIWKFKPFSTKDTKIITVFFGIYTCLWLWLIYLILFPRSNSTVVVPKVVDETGTKTDQIGAYWNQQQISDYIQQMPGLIDTYENLYMNNELGTEAGNASANDIFNQIENMTAQVLSIAELNQSNAAYMLQQSVNESATLFQTAIEEGRNAINSGDLSQIENAMSSWNNAENSFYEINYIYDQAISSANNQQNANQNNNSNDIVIVEDSSVEIENSNNSQPTQENQPQNPNQTEQNQTNQENQQPADESQTPQTLEATTDNLVQE